jgi:excisionase family DNA binding protein
MKDESYPRAPRKPRNPRQPRLPRLRNWDPSNVGNSLPAELYLTQSKEVPMSDEFMKMTDCLLNVNEVSKLLNVKKATIYYWVHKQSIPHVKFPGAVRFQAYEVLEWIKKQKRGGRTDLVPAAIATKILKDFR